MTKRRVGLPFEEIQISTVSKHRRFKFKIPSKEVIETKDPYFSKAEVYTREK